MLQAAIERNVLGKNSVIRALSSWDKLVTVAENLPQPFNVLFNATYLFASKSLEVDDVCEVVRAFMNSSNVKEMAFVYTNGQWSGSGTKFDAFKRKMRGSFSSDGCAEHSIKYRKKVLDTSVESANFVHEFLKFKG
jgi:hypothetical protein